MSDKKVKVVRLNEEKIVDIIDKLATEEVNKRLAEHKKAEKAKLIEGKIQALNEELKELNGEKEEVKENEEGK